MSLRVFAGISVPMELSRELKNWRQEIPAEKWTYKTDYHLTLAFLGSVEEAQLPAIEAAMAGVASRHPSFEMPLDEFGAFPDERDAIVFWAGQKKKAVELLDLASDLRAEFKAQGIAFDEKPFMPHVTLSRFRRGEDIRHRIKKFNRQTVNVSKICLFATKPSGEVPRYETKFEFPLKPQ